MKTDKSVSRIIDVIFPIVGAVRHIKKATSKVEPFEVDEEDLSEDPPSSVRYFFVIVIYLLIHVGAMYLHYTCNNKFGWGAIPALVGPWFYLVWYAFTKDTCIPTGIPMDQPPVRVNTPIPAASSYSPPPPTGPPPRISSKPIPPA
jgi:hypothetical protein